MARIDRFCLAVLLAGVVAVTSSYEESKERSDFLCRDDGIGCSPGGAFDTSHESSFGVDDLFKEVHEDTETRDDLYKEIDHTVDVDTHIRDDLLKEIEDPVDMDTQVQYVDVGNHKAPESSAGVVIGNEVSETVKHPDSYGTPGTSYSREEPPAGVVEIKVPIKDDTNIVGSIDTIVKGNEDGGKNTENTGSWPNSLHEMLENIPYKEKPYVSVDSNSYYSYHEPGDNGKVEVYSYWGPGSIDVKEPPKKPPGPKPKPENPIMDVGSSLLREIVRVPLAIKDELKRFALKLLKFTGKGVKGLIKEAKRIILKIHGFFRDGTNALITKIEELLRYVIWLLSGSEKNLPSKMT